MKSADHAFVGPALLLLVAAVHLGYLPAAQLYPQPEQAARGIYYAATALQAAVLYALVWRALPGRSLATSIACAWGIAESAQAGVCRLAVGFGRVPLPDDGSGLCSRVAGLPVAGLTMLGVLVALALLQETTRDATAPR